MITHRRLIDVHGPHAAVSGAGARVAAARRGATCVGTASCGHAGLADRGTYKKKVRDEERERESCNSLLETKRPCRPRGAARVGTASCGHARLVDGGSYKMSEREESRCNLNCLFMRNILTLF